ncbi:MAG: adenylate/guanylate cyclase domain-containing protein [Paracoccaceae bacterium]
MSETRQQRRLAAILAADVVGYTSAMAADEAGTLARLQALLREVVAPAVAGQDGRIFKEMGDGILVEFPSAVGAAQCAAAIQAALAASNSALHLRIGLHVGDVIVEGDDLFGDGVNIAARLQAEAEPGGIVASNAFRRHAEGRAGLVFEDLGTRRLKNVAEPMQVHLLRRDGGGDAPRAAAPARAPLRRLALAGVAAAVLGLVALWVAPQFLDGDPPGTAQASGTPAVAILPFDNLSQDVEQAYFADGLAEDLITDLSRIEGIQVVSRTSSFAYRGEAVPVAEIAGRLKVRYVVEGSVRRAGGRLRITASLIDTLSDTPVWSQRFDGAADDVFGFQDEITGDIIAALRVQLTPAEQQAVETRGTDNPAAYDAYLRGLRLLSARRRLDVEANAAARAAFEEATRLDPEYALAYAGLGWTKWLYMESINSFDDKPRFQAFDLAEKSIALEDNALAHRVLARQHLALMNYWVDSTRKIDLAVKELEAARRLQPSDPDVLADLAIALNFEGRPDEALELIQKAMERNPNHPEWYFAASGIASLFVGETDRAVRDLKKWSDSMSSWNVPYVFLASALALSGKEGEANLALATFDRLSATLSGPEMDARRTQTVPAEPFEIRTSIYAVKRRWPMAPEQEALFVKGLKLAGMKGEN